MARLIHRSDGPPYILNEAQLGGLPTLAIDIPTATTFLLLFTAAAIASIYLFAHRVRDLRRGTTSKRFAAIVWALTFLFSGERVLACALRIAWTHRLGNVRLAVAAQVFLHAGVLLLYLLNVLLAKRILKEGTTVGGRKLRLAFVGMVVLTVSSLVMLITAMVVSVYTLDEGIRARCRDVERAGVAYFVVFAAVPLVILWYARYLRTMRTTSCFSSTVAERLLHKRIRIVVLSSLLCLLNAGFKAGVLWSPSRALFDPAWYHAPWCLYVFFFTTELFVLLLLFLSRVDGVFESRSGHTMERHMSSAELVRGHDLEPESHKA